MVAQLNYRLSMLISPLLPNNCSSIHPWGALVKCPAWGFSDHLKLVKVASDDEEGAMRKGRFSEEQMVGILRETDKDPVAQVAKRHGVSEQTIYGWRQRFSGMNADDVKRLRLLLTALMEPAMCTPNGATLGGVSGVRTHRKVRCFPPHRQRGF